MRFWAILLLLLSNSVYAFGPKRLNPEQLKQCDELAATKLQAWKKADLRKLPAPSTDREKYPYELPLRLVVLNHKSYWEGPIDEDEIAYHLEQTRTAFHQCGIE